MALYKYLREIWKKPKENLKEIWRNRLIELRKQPSILRIEKPTRLDRARSLGYKAKQGYVIVRVKLPRGGRKRPRPLKHGRRSKRATIRKVVGKSYQWVAEERANRKFPNCEVLGSYWIAKDGKYYWFEIILADRIQVSKYPNMDFLLHKRGKVFRGLTSAARKSRGLTSKGRGYEKHRPSLRAHRRTAK